MVPSTGNTLICWSKSREGPPRRLRDEAARLWEKSERIGIVHPSNWGDRVRPSSTCREPTRKMEINLLQWHEVTGQGEAL